MSDHELKCWPEHYTPLAEGLKTAELRFNDRGYKAGDTLTLREYVPDTKIYTGQFVRRRIRHVADISAWAPGYVLLSLEEM